MFKKGDWVQSVLRRGQKMRVQRVQRDQRPGEPGVWCEWKNGGYHVECHAEDELRPVPREQWPLDL